MNRLLICLMVALPLRVAAGGQQDPAPAAPKAAPKSAPANDIFSGTVTELTDDSVTVIRKVPARDAVTRKFARDGQTRVEGPLRVKARVSVRYETGEDGQLRALHIIVR